MAERAHSKGQMEVRRRERKRGGSAQSRRPLADFEPGRDVWVGRLSTAPLKMAGVIKSLDP